MEHYPSLYVFMPWRSGQWSPSLPPDTRVHEQSDSQGATFKAPAKTSGSMQAYHPKAYNNFKKYFLGGRP